MNNWNCLRFCRIHRPTHRKAKKSTTADTSLMISSQTTTTMTTTTTTPPSSFDVDNCPSISSSPGIEHSTSPSAPFSSDSAVPGSPVSSGSYVSASIDFPYLTSAAPDLHTAVDNDSDNYIPLEQCYSGSQPPVAAAAPVDDFPPQVLPRQVHNSCSPPTRRQLFQQTSSSSISATQFLDIVPPSPCHMPTIRPPADYGVSVVYRRRSRDSLDELVFPPPPPPPPPVTPRDSTYSDHRYRKHTTSLQHQLHSLPHGTSDINYYNGITTSGSSPFAPLDSHLPSYTNVDATDHYDLVSEPSRQFQVEIPPGIPARTLPPNASTSCIGGSPTVPCRVLENGHGRISSVSSTRSCDDSLHGDVGLRCRTVTPSDYFNISSPTAVPPGNILADAATTRSGVRCGECSPPSSMSVSANVLNMSPPPPCLSADQTKLHRYMNAGAVTVGAGVNHIVGAGHIHPVCPVTLSPLVSSRNVHMRVITKGSVPVYSTTSTLPSVSAATPHPVDYGCSSKVAGSVSHSELPQYYNFADDNVKQFTTTTNQRLPTSSSHTFSDDVMLPTKKRSNYTRLSSSTDDEDGDDDDSWGSACSSTTSLDHCVVPCSQSTDVVNYLTLDLEQPEGPPIEPDFSELRRGGPERSSGSTVYGHIDWFLTNALNDTRRQLETNRHHSASSTTSSCRGATK